MFENFRVAFIGLRSNKLRSFLTMLGITIGVAAVIVLVSVGQAVERFVRDEFEGIGANLLFVFGFSEDGGFTLLTQREVEALSDSFRVPDAINVMPQRGGQRTVVAEGREVRVAVQGITPTYQRLYGREVIAGRFIDQDDVDAASRVAVLGLTTVEQLFPDVYPVGQTVRINGLRFTVIGVLDQGSDLGAPGTQNNVILTPITTVQTRLSNLRVGGGDRPVDFIVVQARDSDSVEATALQIRETLREVRDIAFRAEEDFQVLASNELLDTFNRITSLITLFLAVLAGISLLVGGIGIMNIMLVTVTERTREIGLRKAVGARDGDILLQFLVEATVLALVGGAIGVLLAMGASALISLIPNLQVDVQLTSILLATAISILIGVFFGSYPAGRASRLNPIDALRYE
jgi:putative ABC transport system permease protein